MRRGMLLYGLAACCLAAASLPGRPGAGRAQQGRDETGRAAPRAKASARGPAAGLARRLRSFFRRAEQARTVTAVAAVRGANPLGPMTDFDKALRAKAAALRESAASESPAEGAEASLRKIYRALAAAHLAVAVEKDPSSERLRQVSPVLSDLAPRLRRDGMPARVLRQLAAAGPGLGAGRLAAAGWGRYAGDLASEVETRMTARTRRFRPVPATAELDEKLSSVMDACLSKELAPGDLADGLLLAGLLYRGLAAADYRGDPSIEPDDAGSLPPDEDAAAPAAGPSPAFDPPAIYAAAAPAVVFLLCSSPDGEGEVGSGSIIDSRGRILTNAHVVVRDSTRRPWDRIQVYLKPADLTGDPDRDLANPYAARVVHQDRRLDLALIEVEGPPPGLRPLPFGRSSRVLTGERVAAIGHPEQGGLWSITDGVVSGVVAGQGGVKDKDTFQTNAGINRGNSGGPLINAAGELIGVATSMSRTSSDGTAITGVNFALKSSVARRWLKKKGVLVAYAAAPPRQPAKLEEALGAPAAGEAGAAMRSEPVPALRAPAFRERRSADEAPPAPARAPGGLGSFPGGGAAAHGRARSKPSPPSAGARGADSPDFQSSLRSSGGLAPGFAAKGSFAGGSGPIPPARRYSIEGLLKRRLKPR